MTSEDREFLSALMDRLESRLEAISEELHKTAVILEEVIDPTLGGLIGLLQERLPRPNP